MTISTTVSTTEELDTITEEVSGTAFLKGFKSKLQQAFHIEGNLNELSIRRGLPPGVLNEIMSCNPLSVCIPSQYGGRGAPVHEILAIMSAASYESLALSLTLSINYSLFIQPVNKYGQESVKAPIFKRFLQNQNMGGLMITEPDHGSDALNMKTFYTEQNGHYHIQGRKHWAGLTGMANYWLLTARKRDENGLRRDIDFFICDVEAPSQEIIVEEYFENLGLYQIPYGRNRINVHVPAVQRLVPKTSGVKMMLDILHLSRIQFPGVGIGFIKRMLDEAILHCQQRHVNNHQLSSYDQVQQRLARLQSNYTVCSALCIIGSEIVDRTDDFSQLGLEANINKSITTDMMQESSQSLLQLVGAKGYKLNHIAGRSTVDSRPFQIFEGSNDILYIQIAETICKLMNAAKEKNFLQFLKGFRLTSLAAEYLHQLLNFNPGQLLPQRKLMELGQIISRVVAMNSVLKLSERGFRPDLITNALNMLDQEITTLICNYSYLQKTLLVEEYEENSSWLSFIREK